MMPIRSNVLMILSIPILIYGLKCVVDSAYMQGLMLILASTAMGRLGSMMYGGRIEMSIEGDDEDSDV